MRNPAHCTQRQAERSEQYNGCDEGMYAAGRWHYLYSLSPEGVKWEVCAAGFALCCPANLIWTTALVQAAASIAEVCEKVFRMNGAWLLTNWLARCIKSSWSLMIKLTLSIWGDRLSWLMPKRALHSVAVYSAALSEQSRRAVENVEINAKDKGQWKYAFYRSELSSMALKICCSVASFITVIKMSTVT